MNQLSRRSASILLAGTILTVLGSRARQRPTCHCRKSYARADHRNRASAAPPWGRLGSGALGLARRRVGLG
jgi:hypothetical protein